MSEIFDASRCKLGEGALWHPGRQALFWFDILGRRMFMRGPNGSARHWDFPEFVSAAGIVDDDRLVVASATALSLFDIGSGQAEPLIALEADNRATRSNDGRADPYGGFWIGTIGLNGDGRQGAIWRYYRGELRRLFDRINITNSICFTPDGGHACFCDTSEAIIRRVRLDAQGWPVAEPEAFIDLRADGLSPDGAVIDAEGALWSAQWGASRVACYGHDGSFREAISFPASQISCPAFGGADLSVLFATSARIGLKDPAPEDGQTFFTSTGSTGQAEHRVVL